MGHKPAVPLRERMASRDSVRAQHIGNANGSEREREMPIKTCPYCAGEAPVEASYCTEWGRAIDKPSPESAQAEHRRNSMELNPNASNPNASAGLSPKGEAVDGQQNGTSDTTTNTRI